MMMIKEGLAIVWPRVRRGPVPVTRTVEAPEQALAPQPSRRLSLRRLVGDVIGFVERVVVLLAGPPRASGIASWVLLAAFAAQITLLLPRHEPWFDEAQAWLLARDASPAELFSHLLRYEGSPGLWHLILMVPAKLGLPYVSMQVIAAVFAVAGAALIAFRSPFPLLIRAGLLFSFVIGYQYALVARSYVLLPLLLFAVAAVWPERFRHVGLLAMVLALLAMVSLHGFLVAGSISVVHACSAVRHWRGIDTRTRVAHLVAGASLVVLAAAIVIVLLPSDDVLAVATATPLHKISLVHLAKVIPLLFNSSLTGNPLASLAAVAATALWFFKTRTFSLWLLPTLALLLLSSLRYHSPWHDGVAFLVLVFALWISVDRPREADRRRLWLRATAVAALGGVLIVQTVWWFQTAAYDWWKPYSGTKELAAYLAKLDEDTTVYATSFNAIGALPYLEDNPFDNFRDGQLPAYMSWSTTTPVLKNRWVDAYLAQPDVIVWSEIYGWQERLPYFPGYRRILGQERFKGALYWKNQVLGPNAFIVYERVDPAR